VAAKNGKLTKARETELRKKARPAAYIGGVVGGRMKPKNNHNNVFKKNQNSLAYC